MFAVEPVMMLPSSPVPCVTGGLPCAHRHVHVPCVAALTIADLARDSEGPHVVLDGLLVLAEVVVGEAQAAGTAPLALTIADLA